MKIRTDFVSNSSSSSFIVAAEDNKFLSILNEPTALTLSDYIDRYGDREFDFYPYDNYSYYLDSNPKKRTVRFVDDAEFCKLFLTSRITDVLPICAKAAYDDFVIASDVCKQYRQNFKDRNWDDLILSIISDENSRFSAKVIEQCKMSLSTKLKDMIFCQQEIEDNYVRDYCGEDYESQDDKEAEQKKKNAMYNIIMDGDTIYSEEDLIRSKINYMNSYKPLKFLRIFSNH